MHPFLASSRIRRLARIIPPYFCPSATDHGPPADHADHRPYYHRRSHHAHHHSPPDASALSLSTTVYLLVTKVLSQRPAPHNTIVSSKCQCAVIASKLCRGASLQKAKPRNQPRQDVASIALRRFNMAVMPVLLVIHVMMIPRRPPLHRAPVFGNVWICPQALAPRRPSNLAGRRRW